MNPLNHKLWYLTKISLKRKIKSKWFLIVNIILLLVITAIFNIDRLISFFGGDFNEKQKIYIIDHAGLYDPLKETINQTTLTLTENKKDAYDVILYKKNLEDGKKKIKQEKDAILIEINTDEQEILKTKLISNSYIDSFDLQIITSALTTIRTNIGITQLGLTEKQIKKLYEQPNIERIILDKTKKSEEENMEMMMTTIFPIIILPFFILSIYLVQMIGAEVNDEKTTRGMEIIISNVSPKTHFTSKIIAGNAFVLLQGSILLLDSGIALLIRNLIGSSSTISGGFDVIQIIKDVLGSSLMDQLIYLIPLMLVSMILTFIAYSLVAGVLASMTTNTEDFQQIQTPIILVSLVGYYLAMMASVFEGAAFIKILSFFPFISAILGPSLLLLGQITVVDFIISIGILIITLLVFMKYGLKIYKVGILNYSSKNLWKKMIKAVKD